MIKTVGELKAWLIENEIPDDAPVWIGETTVEGGLEYFSRVRKYEVDTLVVNETFGILLKYEVDTLLVNETFGGILLPKNKQRTETGVVFY